MDNKSQKPLDDLIYNLKERAKELNCLYQVQEILGDPEKSLETICDEIIAAIPPGWQYPEICQAEIRLYGKSCRSEQFIPSHWIQKAEIHIQEEIIGEIRVSYREKRPHMDEGPFLKEERKLINTIAELIGYYIFNRQLKAVFQEQKLLDQNRRADWWTILNLLRRTDPRLLVRISRKMINYLCWSKIPGAEQLLQRFNPTYQTNELLEDNKPSFFKDNEDRLAVSDDIFELASKHFPEEVILEHIHQWIKEDQSNFLVNTLANPSSSLEEISSALARFHHLASQGLELTRARANSARVSLIRHLLSNETSFIKIAKEYLAVDDFHDLINHTIYPISSHGKLGGKSSGLFLATRILQCCAETEPLLDHVKTPKTWYIPSDNLFWFIGHNGLEDIVENKYKPPEQVKQEYPYVVHMFKNANFSAEIIKGLSLALDDFGDVPLIVRSSSLLEDRMGMAFAGKYKSLFISNLGSKKDRLEALMDAIAEVYASMFGPDPLEYRREHDLLDHHEEMGIMVQEVVGKRVGPYFFPAYAGVAFSNNEFRWSSRIQREDGLIRLVPGLGTRAVDRVSNDYPIMVAPGQPGLRVNVSLEEIVRYSPKKIDVINLEKGAFETIEIKPLLGEYGKDYPAVEQVVSLLEEDHIKLAGPFVINFEQDELVVTFERLFTKSSFLAQIKAILDTLQESFQHPVDVEFAFDGKDFYLLQCRSQSYQEDSTPAQIPLDLEDDQIIFSADRYISNGTVNDISHIVYVDPEQYSKLPNYQDLIDVARAVSSLNNLLPRRQFILMGPGRWGSRGEPKMGVKVTWSDIRNTAMLIEIAFKQGDYMPDLSFGTHFFQDLVESSIRYLPLYPDDPGIIFQKDLLLDSTNLLPALLPDSQHLADVIHVVNIPSAFNGKEMKILMNAEREKAVAYLAG